MSDEEWAIIALQILPGVHGGWRRSIDVRAVLNCVLYVLETGYQWRHLPKDLPARSTCHSYLQLWAWDGTLERIHQELAAQEDERTATMPMASPRPYIRNDINYESELYLAATLY